MREIVKAKVCLYKENGWADSDEAPTHLILQFTSSLGGAFIGSQVINFG